MLVVCTQSSTIVAETAWAVGKPGKSIQNLRFKASTSFSELVETETKHSIGSFIKKSLLSQLSRILVAF
jgi:hypothetical protein